MIGRVIQMETHLSKCVVVSVLLLLLLLSKLLLLFFSFLELKMLTDLFIASTTNVPFWFCRFPVVGVTALHSYNFKVSYYAYFHINRYHS